MALHRYLGEAARRDPARVAVVEPGAGQVGYGALDALSDRVRDRLRHAGVGPGERVGVCLPKSIDAVAVLLGVLKAGAAYVPVDVGAPMARNAFILDDCQVAAIFVADAVREALASGQSARGPGPQPAVWSLTPAAGAGLGALLDALDAEDPAPPGPTAASEPSDLAYVLYTSGSTGQPKGVMLSHGAAESFVDWCEATFDPQPEDRFSSHAPFHFDLSILDLYLPHRAGATLVLVPEAAAREPGSLARLVAEERLSVWYSAPSILAMMVDFGKLEAHDASSLRLVLFAGEVFPVRPLRALRERWPRPAFWNLYGPTETNVCTAYALPQRIPADRRDPFPIGTVCSHLRGLVLGAGDRPVSPGEEGELCIAGPAVMDGYWGLPERTGSAFFVDGEGTRWYRTGDVVVAQADGNLRFLGRRDRMIKKRGYRIELGEIEACLHRHEAVREAATAALEDEKKGVQVHAWLATHDGGRLSLIALKRFCSEHLPLYMVPDVFHFRDALPKTSTDKVDYQKLRAS